MPENFQNWKLVVAPFNGFFPVRPTCKGTVGCGEEFLGAFLRGDSAVSSCPGWNAGAWPHIPHGGSTGDTQRSQCSGQTDKSSESWPRPFFHTKNNSLQFIAWALTLFLHCMMLLLHANALHLQIQFLILPAVFPQNGNLALRNQYKFLSYIIFLSCVSCYLFNKMILTWCLCPPNLKKLKRRALYVLGL